MVYFYGAWYVVRVVHSTSTGHRAGPEGSLTPCTIIASLESHLMGLEAWTNQEPQKGSGKWGNRGASWAGQVKKDRAI